MEAARTAAIVGHSVVVCEKSDALGGNLIPGGVPHFKRNDHKIQYCRDTGICQELWGRRDNHGDWFPCEKDGIPRSKEGGERRRCAYGTRDSR